MAFRLSSSSLVTIAGVSLAGLLAGCSGNTYGTGVSAQQQLASDLGGIVLLGQGSKREQINYNSRPKLVNAPVGATLPPPVDADQANNGYFPEDPETRRQRLLKEIDEAEANGTALPEEAQALREESRARQQAERTDYIDHIGGVGATIQRSVKEIRRVRAQLDQNQQQAYVNGPKPRRYLTEPPIEYRTPEQSAEIGSVGESELSEAQRNKKERVPLYRKIFGG